MLSEGGCKFAEGITFEDVFLFGVNGRSGIPAILKEGLGSAAGFGLMFKEVIHSSPAGDAGVGEDVVDGKRLRSGAKAPLKLTSKDDLIVLGDVVRKEMGDPGSVQCNAELDFRAGLDFDPA